jgi:hypothetical protein
MSVGSTIEIDAEEALAVVQSVLPALESYLPSVAAIGGPLGLGVSALSALLPLINLIPSGLISVAGQADLVNRVNLLGSQFGGPEWQPRPGG